MVGIVKMTKNRQIWKNEKERKWFFTFIFFCDNKFVLESWFVCVNFEKFDQDRSASPTHTHRIFVWVLEYCVQYLNRTKTYVNCYTGRCGGGAAMLTVIKLFYSSMGSNIEHRWRKINVATTTASNNNNNNGNSKQKQINFGREKKNRTTNRINK